MMIFATNTGLNPFEIRAGLEPYLAANSTKSDGLNPFEIRAGLEQVLTMNVLVEGGLNPFEIRAGLEHRVVVVPYRDPGVLIPLKSGQVWNLRNSSSLISRPS